MATAEIRDHWREQHEAWLARRDRLRADRTARKTRRDHGLRRRQAAKLARNAKKAATPDEPEMAA
jgi:hypothetical protein